MRKYKLTDETVEYRGRTLHRIEALVDFGDVHAGDQGGWVESERNLDQYGNCWVSGNAKVVGQAVVIGNAIVEGRASVNDFAFIFSRQENPPLFRRWDELAHGF